MHILTKEINGVLFYSYRHKGRVLALIVASTLLGLASPLLHGALLDALHTGRALSFVLGIVGITIALELVSLALGFWLEAVRMRSGAELVVELRNRVWNHLAAIPMQEVYRKPPGEWMQKLNGDTELVCNAFLAMVFGFLNFGLFFVETAVVIFIKAPAMLLFFLVVAAAGAMTHRRHKAEIVRRARQMRDGSYAFGLVSFDLLMMHPLFRMFGLKEVFRRKFERQNALMAKRHIASQGTSMHYSIALGIEMAIVHGAILSVCIVMYARGRIALGDIWVYDMLVSQLAGGVNRLLEMLPQMDQGRESGKSLSEFFAIPEEEAVNVTDMEKLARSSPVVPAINAKDLCFSYSGAKSPVINGCNISVRKDEMACLIGRNGAGKSTLVNLALGILKPTEGTIDTGFANPAIVPQRVNIFKASVLENIRLYDSAIGEDAVRKCVEICGLGPWLSTLRGGLRAKISPETVSGGELQRLAIARALVRDPDLLIVDEITNNLDIIEKQRIRKILQGLKGGRTILAVTHDIDMAEDCDRCFVFADGRIHEVMADQGKTMAEAALKELKG